jgi:hypothetical protein
VASHNVQSLARLAQWPPAAQARWCGKLRCDAGEGDVILAVNLVCELWIFVFVLGIGPWILCL